MAIMGTTQNTSMQKGPSSVARNAPTRTEDMDKKRPSGPTGAVGKPNQEKVCPFCGHVGSGQCCDVTKSVIKGA